MKRFFALLISMVLALSCVPAMAETAPVQLSVVTTIFPIYDWVENLLGDRAETMNVTMLLDNGTDLHSYQPTVEDMLKVASCDLFIYVGGESDSWVEDALKESINPNMVVINLLDVLGDQVKEEEVVEGMEAEEEEAEEDKEEAPELDEHVWLSLRNASTLCGAISDALTAIDPAGAENHTAALTAYQEKLAALDEAYINTIAASAQHTVLFGDRFPFRYLVDDYGLDYYAAFVGCSAETEASFETIVFLSGKVDALQLPAVLTIEGANHSIAKTIVDNTQQKDQQILTLDSMQSVTAEEVASGADYLSIMENNLTVLAEALK